MHLGHVTVRSREPRALQTLLGDALGLARGELRPTGDPVLGVGGINLVLLGTEDPVSGATLPTGVEQVGFVDDNAQSKAVLKALPAAPDASRLGEEGAVRDTATGLALTVGAALDVDWLGTPSVSLVERFDHIGVASADNRAAEALLCDQLGFAVESRQTDMEVRTHVESFTSDRYGVVYHSRTPEPVGGLRVSFITVGECELEFLEEVDTAAMAASRDQDLGTRPGTTRQDQGAIGRYVTRRGPGLHHLALKTPDIDTALTRLGEAGAELIDRVGRPGSRRARIGFVHPRSTGGVLMHLVERTPLAD